jgi:hypothetical protein
VNSGLRHFLACASGSYCSVTIKAACALPESVPFFQNHPRSSFQHVSPGAAFSSGKCRNSLTAISTYGVPFLPQSHQFELVGRHIGLSEIEVYHDPAARPEVRRAGEFTDYVSYVDPTIETGRGRWFFCTPGSRPFGMVCASAYTRNKNQGGGGYNYNSTEILGFAQIHAWIMSGINIMPTTGEVSPNLGETGWKSNFSHDTETIEPGYHKLFLDRYKMQVEYTSTDRTAFYRPSRS